MNKNSKRNKLARRKAVLSSGGYGKSEPLDSKPKVGASADAIMRSLRTGKYAN